MALGGDTNRRVITTFVADTTNHESGLTRIAERAHEMGASVAEGAVAANEGLNSTIEKVGAVFLAFEGLKKIGEFVWDGYKDGISDARNATTAFGVDLEKLTAASHGLVTENDLLAFSAKAMKSAYGNTQEDMEVAQRAMYKLERQGVSVADATNAVTMALVEGKTKGLEPYGIVIDRHIKGMQLAGDENMTLAQRTELHTRALKGLRDFQMDVADGEDAMGDSMGRSITKVKNAWDDMKKSIGDLAVAMEPLIQALAAVVGKINDIINGAKGIGGGFGSKVAYNLQVDKAYAGWKEMNADGAEPTEAQLASIYALAAHESGYNALTEGGTSIRAHQNAEAAGKARDAAIEKKREGAGSDDPFAGEFVMDEADLRPIEEARKKASDAAVALYKEHEKRSRELADKVAKSTTDDLVKQLEGEGVGGATYNTDYMSNAHAEGAAMNDELTKAFGVGSVRAGPGVNPDGYAQFEKKQGKKFLEGTFGKITEFEAYKKAFESLTGAVGSAMGAWIDGSMSAGDAFKKFIAEALKGLASQMLIESLKHAAYALGSLAFYDYGGAARHAAAAAAFAVGAGAAAVGAKELGGSAPSASGGGSSAGASGSGGSTGTSTSSSGSIIVYGDSFSEDSPRMRGIKAQKMVTKALGNAALSNS